MKRKLSLINEITQMLTDCNFTTLVAIRNVVRELSDAK